MADRLDVKGKLFMHETEGDGLEAYTDYYLLVEEGEDGKRYAVLSLRGIDQEVFDVGDVVRVKGKLKITMPGGDQGLKVMKASDFPARTIHAKEMTLLD